jgi:hypothetical protein
VTATRGTARGDRGVETRARAVDAEVRETRDARRETRDARVRSFVRSLRRPRSLANGRLTTTDDGAG